MSESDKLSRVFYFNGEYLRVAELKADQDYHIDRRERHDRLLHVSGVCAGLKIGGANKAITISEGTAIDQKGRTIVLGSATAIEIDPKGPGNGTYYVYIEFHEELGDEQIPNVPSSKARLTQKPVFALRTTVGDGDGVVLGQVTISGVQNADCTDEGRVYSGLRLAGGYGDYSLRVVRNSYVDENNVTRPFDQLELHREGSSPIQLFMMHHNAFAFYVPEFLLGLGKDSEHPDRRPYTALYDQPLVNGNRELLINAKGEWAKAVVNSPLTVAGALEVTGDATVTGSLTVGVGVDKLDVGAEIVALRNELNQATKPWIQVGHEFEHDTYLPSLTSTQPHLEVKALGGNLHRITAVMITITSTEGLISPPSYPVVVQCEVLGGDMATVTFRLGTIPFDTDREDWRGVASVSLYYDPSADPIEVTQKLVLERRNPPPPPQ